MREVLGDKYVFSVSCILCVIRLVKRRLLRSISFLISVTVLRRFAPDGEILFGYTDGVGLWHSKGKAGGRVPFYGVTKDGSKKTEAYFSFVQDGLITGPAQTK